MIDHMFALAEAASSWDLSGIIPQLGVGGTMLAAGLYCMKKMLDMLSKSYNDQRKSDAMLMQASLTMMNSQAELCSRTAQTLTEGVKLQLQATIEQRELLREEQEFLRALRDFSSAWKTDAEVLLNSLREIRRDNDRNGKM